MSVLTIERLAGTVGAEIVDADPERMASDSLYVAAILDALEANGVLVFRGLHVDDATQVAFSKRLGNVEVFGKGEHPEIFRVTLDPAKNPSAQYLRGTFDWHIDGCTDDIPIMRVRGHLQTGAMCFVGDRAELLVRVLLRARGAGVGHHTA